MLAKFKIFDYIDSDHQNVLQFWADSLPMQIKDRARLDLKVEMLEQVGDDLPPKLLQNTRSRHIMELVVNGHVALRLMLCRGPWSLQIEFTFLAGATG